jgi:hypothetical protein
MMVFILKYKCNTKPICGVIKCDRFSTKRGWCINHQDWPDDEVPEENLHLTERHMIKKILPKFNAI